jgi:hypothetical protein
VASLTPSAVSRYASTDQVCWAFSRADGCSRLRWCGARRSAGSRMQLMDTVKARIGESSGLRLPRSEPGRDPRVTSRSSSTNSRSVARRCSSPPPVPPGTEGGAGPCRAAQKPTLPLPRHEPCSEERFNGAPRKPPFRVHWSSSGRTGGAGSEKQRTPCWRRTAEATAEVCRSMGLAV